MENKKVKLESTFAHDLQKWVDDNNICDLVSQEAYSQISGMVLVHNERWLSAKDSRIILKTDVEHTSEELRNMALGTIKQNVLLAFANHLLEDGFIEIKSKSRPNGSVLHTIELEIIDKRLK
jgi:hypothetical protein